jgi:hypothetical protein
LPIQTGESSGAHPTSIELTVPIRVGIHNVYDLVEFVVGGEEAVRKPSAMTLRALGAELVSL